MDEETLSIVHRYISLEWARKILEHDLERILKAGLKYPALFEEATVRVLDRLSLQMRDIKREMQQRGIKVVYRGRRKGAFDTIVYDVYQGNKHFEKAYASFALRDWAFEEIEKAL